MHVKSPHVEHPKINEFMGLLLGYKYQSQGEENLNLAGVHRGLPISSSSQSTPDFKSSLPVQGENPPESSPEISL